MFIVPAVEQYCQKITEKLLETLKKSGLGHLIKSVPKVKPVKETKESYTKVSGESNDKQT